MVECCTTGTLVEFVDTMNGFVRQNEYHNNEVATAPLPYYHEEREEETVELN